jgi:hypothetical protein
VITIYYYSYFGVLFGSLNAYKIKCLSRRDSDGKVYVVEVDRIYEFQGVFLDSEWKG